jgi:phosphohistidine phosphatase
LDECLAPDLILCSTAKRARKTAAKVAKTCGYLRQVNELADLYLAGPESYYHALRDVADDFKRVLVVGHNPGMEDLVLDLIGEFHHMPTGGLAHVELPIMSWANLSSAVKCTLRNFWRPRELE